MSETPAPSSRSPAEISRRVTDPVDPKDNTEDTPDGSGDQSMHGPGSSRRRWAWDWRAWWQHPSDVRSVGEDPDYRFTLANERTFLAWIRTSLALLAGGIAVVQIVPSFSVPGARHILGIPLVLMAIVVAITSYRHWADSERALRMRRPLPLSALPRILGAGIALIGFASFVFILIAGRSNPK
ncbi:DUF202 domain-containing protein [Frankia sp. Cppng1_Ct_nod]|uniref:YidH family protein n=1 Tax=Frankia sp. Cppng1_Ct_nod TaxID=2897162 RepID=UPI0020245404|nr:DUF202 domain-containing protein [Frankia sp. Cppng1_Ct_nod]